MIKLLKSLQSRGHQVTVLTSGVPGYSADELVDGVQIYRSPVVASSKFGRGIRRLVFPVWAITKLVKLKPTVIHLESLGALSTISEHFVSLIFLYFARRIGAVIIKQHTLADSEEDLFRTDGFENRERLRAWKNFSAVVSVSPALHQAVHQYLPDNSYCIINGVDTQTFLPLSEPDRDHFRQSQKIEEDDVIFTFLGSISCRKGFDLLAKAFLELQKLNSNWRLWIIGPRSKSESQNIDEGEVAELISILQTCAGKVTYWGRVDDRQQMAKILASSDIFVFPTRKEGFPNAPLEAMSCGLPIIISRIPGITDLANIEGETGLYINVDDLPGIKKAMITLGTDPIARKTMGRNACVRVKSEFGWDKYIDNWEELYRSLQKNQPGKRQGDSL